MFKQGSQNAKLVRHFTSGKTLTRYEAILMFRVQNLTARIADLRAAGYAIRGEERIDPNQQSYMKYSLCTKAGRR